MKFLMLLIEVIHLIEAKQDKNTTNRIEQIDRAESMAKQGK